MEKRWYKITFYAEMSDEDVKAMKGSFYKAMEESMEIGNCDGLEIEPEQDDFDLDPSCLKLEEDSYILDPRTGQIKIDKCIFDDFHKDTYIDIKFLDEDGVPVNRYTMVAEDDEYIYCDFLDALN